MREQIASCDEFRNTISSGSEYSPGHCIRSFPVLISLLFSFPSCLNHSLLFLLSCPSCPNTSLLFHSISSWILFHSFFAVPGIVLIVIVEIKSRVWGPAMDTNRRFECVVGLSIEDICADRWAAHGKRGRTFSGVTHAKGDNANWVIRLWICLLREWTMTTIKIDEMIMEWWTCLKLVLPLEIRKLALFWNWWHW